MGINQNRVCKLFKIAYAKDNIGNQNYQVLRSTYFKTKHKIPYFREKDMKASRERESRQRFLSLMKKRSLLFEALNFHILNLILDSDMPLKRTGIFFIGKLFT